MKRKICDNPDSSILTATGEKKMICKNTKEHINNRSIFEKIQKRSLLLPKKTGQDRFIRRLLKLSNLLER